MRRTLRAPAALAVVALIGAGCSKAPAENGKTVTSAGSKAAKFAQCMRDHGVREFPDPDPSGELTIDGVVNGSSLDPDAPAFEEAIRACKDLQPSGFMGHKRSTEQQQAALRFAACIRENGVKDFPDPAAGQPLIDTRRIPSTEAPGGMTILNAAMQKCRGVAQAAMGPK